MKLPKLLIALCVLFTLQSNAQNTEEIEMDVFIDNLLKKMTLKEKIGQLNLVTPGGGIKTGAVVSESVEDKIKNGQVGGLFGIFGPEKVRQAQNIAVQESRLHIPLMFGLDVIHGHKTVFPIPLGLSSSWDLRLIEKSARIAAIEASADGLCWTFSPIVDVTRDPRWGRIAEGAGEDPYLGSEIARAMVRGYQGSDLSNDHTVMACVKHFALYGASESGRDYNTVDMSRINMYQNYLPPFKAAIDEGVGSIMTSFNEIDGVPATGNKWLLSDLLRDQWGFNGLVVSDYTSVNEMIAHGLGDLQTVSGLALNAGLDMDMVGEGFLNTLEASVDEGKVTEKQIEVACRRILEAKYKLGLFEDPYRYVDNSRPAKEILTAETRSEARQIAARSMVLLKNDARILPLKKTGTLALIGPLAKDQKNMLGTWAVAGDRNQSVSVLDGMNNVAGTDLEILYAKGANITNDTALAKKVNVFGTRVEIDERSPEEMIAEAVKVADRADVVVAVVGEASEMSGEAASRADISLPESQKVLLKALVQTGKPLVMVVMSGRPLVLTWEDQNIDAILQAWFCGTEAGHAIADVLFGDYNPSGKLPVTFPRNLGQIPIYYNHKNTGRPFNPRNKFTSKYLDTSNDPLYPFGYGLSYTSFEYSAISLSRDQIGKLDSLQVSVTVTNIGKVAGEEVVQLYIQDQVGSITRPVKELKGFQKINLAPKASEKVTFTLSAKDLSFYRSDLSFGAEAGKFNVYIGGNSKEVVETTFELTDK